MHLESNSNAHVPHEYSAPHNRLSRNIASAFCTLLSGHFTHDVAGRSLTFGARVFQISGLSGLSFVRLVGGQLFLGGAGLGLASLGASRAVLGPVYTNHSPLRFAEAEQLPGTECPVG